MADSLLTLIQEFTDRRGLDRPGAVMSSNDDTIRQLRSLANEVISDITSRGAAWTRLRKEATHVTLAAELQGAIDTIAPYGFKRLLADTAFNRTTRTALFGPRGGADWQANEALPTTGPFYSYRLWQGNLYLQPAPPAGDTIAFEYSSCYAILGTLSATDYKARFTADSDVFLLGSELLLAGLHAKFRREKGLSYAQEQQNFEDLITQEIGNAADKGEVNMACSSPRTHTPGFIVPAGSWDL